MNLAETDGQSRTFAIALVVDDHPLFCEALALTLRAVAGVLQVETAGRLEAALARLAQAPRPDVILLDLNLPDVSGYDGLIRLTAACPGVPVIVVSSLADNRSISAALSAGAAGFVPKHSTRETFRAAFAALRAGHPFLPDGYTPSAAPAPGHRDDAIQRLKLLTRQQAVILELICEGKLNKQIAYELSIAETTVKAHVTAIMRKLGVLSRTQAVLVARQAQFDRALPDR